MRAFEDFQVGEAVDCGPVTVTAEAIKSFAAGSIRSRCISTKPRAEQGRGRAVRLRPARRLHVMRLMVDGFLRDTTSMGSPGVDEVRYLAPVRPGDRLTLRLEVIEMRASKAAPTWEFSARSHLLNRTASPCCG